MDWLDEALCQGLSQDLFYPPLDAPSPNHYYAIGKYVCKFCPVWKNCLQLAERNEETWGLWGGLTPQERKRKQVLAHGSLESVRGGCTCSQCRNVQTYEDDSPEFSLLPKSGEDYDLLPLLFKLTKG